ncbi:MAG: hypothetical protein ACLQUY_17055 [Ktedonobacterales bacterium]
MATLDPGARLARGSLIFGLISLALTVLRMGAFLGGGPIARAIPPLAPVLLDQGEPYILVQVVTPLLTLLIGVIAVILGHAALRQSRSRSGSQKVDPGGGLIIGYSVLGFTLLTLLCLLGGVMIG